MSTGLERQYIQYVFLTSNNMGKEIKLKDFLADRIRQANEIYNEILNELL